MYPERRYIRVTYSLGGGAYVVKEFCIGKRTPVC